jgi:hypothetical protein
MIEDPLLPNPSIQTQTAAKSYFFKLSVLTLQRLHHNEDPLKGHPPKSLKHNCTKTSQYIT